MQSIIKRPIIISCIHNRQSSRFSSLSEQTSKIFPLSEYFALRDVSVSCPFENVFIHIRMETEDDDISKIFYNALSLLNESNSFIDQPVWVFAGNFIKPFNRKWIVSKDISWNILWKCIEYNIIKRQNVSIFVKQQNCNNLNLIENFDSVLDVMRLDPKQIVGRKKEFIIRAAFILHDPLTSIDSKNDFSLEYGILPSPFLTKVTNKEHQKQFMEEQLCLGQIPIEFTSKTSMLLNTIVCCILTILVLIITVESIVTFFKIFNHATVQ